MADLAPTVGGYPRGVADHTHAEPCHAVVMASTSRDRDEAGRPRNARPRDALGRPLGHGEQGVPRAPDAALAPAEALDEAQRLVDSGHPFAAHEVLETAWKSAPELERELWQGLAQLAVGLTHALRGNRAGCRSVLLRARDHLVSFGPTPPHGIDVVGLIAWADDLLEPLVRTQAGDTGVAAIVAAPFTLRH